MDWLNEREMDAIERDMLGLSSLTLSIFPDSPKVETAPEVALDKPPYANCVRISARAGGGRMFGSGLIVGPTLVLTAGHCAGELQGDIFTAHDDFVVKTPLDIQHNQAGMTGAVEIHIHRNWSRREGDPFDLALLKMAPGILEPLVFAARPWEDWRRNSRCIVLGFPISEGEPSDKLIVSRGRIQNIAAEEDRLFHNAATLEGNSGAPLILALASGISVVGLHVGGRNITALDRNVAVRFDASIASEAGRWAAGANPDVRFWEHIA